VFLDTQADKYFCLPRQANDAFLRLSRNAAPGYGKDLQPLLARGLLIEAGDDGNLQAAARIERPKQDWLRGPAGRVRPIAIFAAIASELRVAKHLRSTTLQQVLDHSRALRVRPRSTRSKVHRSVTAVAAAKAWASFINRSHDRCLVRALAAHSLCKRAGAPTKLVFGVIAHPFSAHCWVQLDAAVVVGGYEQARLYTPILVVE